MSASEQSLVEISIDSLLEGVQIIGFDWKYLYLNDTAARHGRRTAAQLVGRTITAAYPGIEDTEMFGVLRRVMQTRRAEQLVNEFTYPDGSRRWFRLHVNPVPDGICVLSLDITETRHAELQLQQAQKLEAIGQLAGGVAHDLNNILTAILGYSEMITGQIGPDKPIGRDMQEIVAAAERASALTRRLLTFARTSEVTNPGSVSLHQVIEQLEPMLRRLIPENIDFHLEWDAEADTVWADPTQIEQMLLNLVVNARDAMPGGGIITIATRSRDADAVLLIVSDTGTGMTSEVRARIFEPFFTTKAPGLGTGLGLAAVADIVGQLQGEIQVHSAPAQGTRFEIRLPVSDQPPRVAESRERGMAPVGSETVLVVEDEPGVRAFARTVLKRHGYRVLEAVSGESALSLLDRDATPVDLLITDVVLPGMNGPALARALRERRPELPVLYISGYALPTEGQPPPAAEVLMKPFTGTTLLSRARESLEPRP